jgi:hypothetical protein
VRRAPAAHHRAMALPPRVTPQSKIKRKEALEAELAAIEADIKLLQRGDLVLVVRGD